MRHSQKIITLCVWRFLAALSMENPTAQKIYQPTSLKSLAAATIAREIDPTISINRALNAFNSNLLDHQDVSRAIALALAHRSQPALKAILKQQPLVLVSIERFSTFPQNLTSLSTHGLYVRSKKNGYNIDAPDPLHQGIATLIPDPLVSHAPSRFFQIYSNPRGIKYFDDDDDMEQGRDATSRGIAIWDKKSGKLMSDGKVIRTELLRQFPHIANPDPHLHNFFLYGLSADDSVAWCRFIYENASRHVLEATCAFDVENNKLLHTSNFFLYLLSYSGKYCALNSDQTLHIADSQTLQEKTIIRSPFRIACISPQDNYVLLRSPYGFARIANPETKKLSALTINNRPFRLKNGSQNPLNADGSLIAVLRNNKIYILQPLANKTQCTFEAVEDDNTLYRLTFSPDSTELLALRMDLSSEQYQLTVFDIAAQAPCETYGTNELQPGDDITDFIFCNEGDYLLLPTGQLRIQPQGLVNHLSPKQVLGLLILETQKSLGLPLNHAVLALLTQNHFPRINRLIAQRYQPV